jgi:S1-C subfamily serine protease
MALRRPLFVLALLVVIAVAVLGAACSDGSSPASSPSPAAPATAESGSTASSGDGGSALSTVDLVQRLRPSVVHIASEVAAADIFGQLNPQQGVGTGFIIDSQGHIVTNNHVVTLDSDTPAQKITVTLADGRQFQARIVGRDPPTDLAVLKIDASGLQPAPVGDSSSLQVGQDVVAIGNALDLAGGPTVTKGVVSALNRVIEESTVSIPDAIQTDASINPGNSGGPLVDMRGRVVGITTAVIRGNAESIGLAISIDSAKPVVDELIRNGKVARGFLGVQIAPLNSFTTSSCGITRTDQKGLLLSRVQSGSPAGDAGLRQCDIITKIAGVDITNTGDLFRALTQHRAGEKVPVEYLRGGQSQSGEITLG